MTDMFNEVQTVDFGQGETALWNDKRVAVRSVSGNRREIEWRVPGEKDPVRRWVDIADLSPVVDASVPIPPKVPAEAMPKFRVGQKVVIIKTSGGPEVREIYTITEVDAKKPPFLYTLKGAKTSVPAIKESQLEAAPEAPEASAMFMEQDMRRKIEELEAQLVAARKAQFDELYVAQQAIQQRDDELVELRGQVATLLDERDQRPAAAPVSASVEVKTLVQLLMPHAEADQDLAVHINGGWSVAHESSFATAGGNFFRIVRLERPRQQPDKQKPMPSLAAILTGDEVFNQIHASAQPPADAGAALEAAAQEMNVNKLEDEATRQQVLYHRRKKTLGAKRAGAMTFARRKRVAVENFEEAFPIAAEMLRDGKDAVIARMNAEVYDAAKKAFNAALPVNPVLPPLSAYRGRSDLFLPSNT